MGKKRTDAEVRNGVVQLMRRGLSLSAAISSVGTSANRVRRLRGEDAAFAEEVRLLTAARRGGVEVRRDELDWKVAFIELVRGGKSRVEALDSLGVGALQVDTALREDPVFAGRLAEVRLREEWEIEDALRKRAKSSTAEARLVLSTRGVGVGSDRAVDVGDGLVDSDVPGWLTSEGMTGAEEWLEGRTEVGGRLANVNEKGVVRDFAFPGVREAARELAEVVHEEVGSSRIQGDVGSGVGMSGEGGLDAGAGSIGVGVTQGVGREDQ